MFSVGTGESCDSVDAVYFELPQNISEINLSLIATDGKTKVTGQLKGGQKFYFELAGLQSIIFSSNPGSFDVLALVFPAIESLAGMNFTEIARIDASFWIEAELDEISMRTANANGNPFTLVGTADWNGLRDKGRRIDNSFRSNSFADQSDIDLLRLNESLDWSVAALMGRGFTDGEHPGDTGPDILGNLLAGPDGKLYCYYVAVELEKEGVTSTVNSNPFFTQAVMMNRLADIDVSSENIPVTRSGLTNHLAGSEGEIIITEPEKEQCYCNSEWKLFSVLPETEIMISVPFAGDSHVTGETFTPAGEFYSGSNTALIEFDGLKYYQKRIHDIKVPYFDSPVWLELVAADGWGRRSKSLPSAKIQPLIDYAGRCIALSECTFDPGLRTVHLKLDRSLDWRADMLAVRTGGHIKLLIKDPRKEEFKVSCCIGPAFPVEKGKYWAGELTEISDESQLFGLPGGTLLVEGFSAAIIAVTPVPGGKFNCIFESVAACAGTDLYVTFGGSAKAEMLENLSSPRLWSDFDEINLLADGLPDAYVVKLDIPEIEGKIDYKFDHSMTFFLSTRLSLNFEGRSYLGPVSTPITVPYLEPPPNAPKLCYVWQQLADDYYGRTLVRVLTEPCPPIDLKYKSRLKYMPGIMDDVDEFSKKSVEGILGHQKPVAGRSILEVFGYLNEVPEGSQLTIGINYWRKQDGSEGASVLNHFEMRKVEK